MKKQGNLKIFFSEKKRKRKNYSEMKLEIGKISSWSNENENIAKKILKSDGSDKKFFSGEKKKWNLSALVWFLPDCFRCWDSNPRSPTATLGWEKSFAIVTRAVWVAMLDPSAKYLASENLRTKNTELFCWEVRPLKFFIPSTKMANFLMDIYHWKYRTSNSTSMHLLATECCQQIPGTSKSNSTLGLKLWVLIIVYKWVCYVFDVSVSVDSMQFLIDTSKTLHPSRIRFRKSSGRAKVAA